MIKNNYQKTGTENKGIALNKSFVRIKNDTTGIALHKPFVRIKNRETGITLIALIITIIVLLILAGVTIAMLTGENGIITKTNEAKITTSQKDAEEAIKLVLNEWQIEKHTGSKTLKEFLISKVPAELDTVIGEGPFEVEKKGYKATVTVDGIIEGELIEIGGTTPTPPVPPSGNVVPGTPVSENTIYTDPKSSNKEAVIPKGFKLSSVEAEQKIDTGLVVIGPDESEFVWVPVNKTTLNADGTANKPVAEIASGSDYRGVLYNFSGITSTPIAYDASGHREPDVVTDYDGNTAYLTQMNGILGTNFLNANDFKTYMQIEYNQIIGSIQTNGGYYVGRYESSITGSTATTVSTTGNIQVKQGVMPTSAGNVLTSSWYGFYSKQKMYVSTLTGTDNNLKSGMIYGSMYDGMLNWALNGEDKTKITAASTKHGPEATGSLAIDDKINNIYDLGNNLREWTTEAYSAGYRAIRRRPLRLYRFAEHPHPLRSDLYPQLLWE